MANGINQVYEDLSEADLPAPNAVPAGAEFTIPGGNPFANNPMLARIFEQQQREAAARRGALQTQMQMIEQQAQRYGQEGMSPLDKASILFQAAGALAAPTRSGGLMESIGSAGSAVSGPLMKAAQAKRDREEKMMQLQMARAKLAAEMGSTGPSASELLQLYRVQQEGIQKPSETERLLQTLPEEERAAAVRSKFGMKPQMGETERLIQTLPEEERTSAIRSRLGVTDPNAPSVPVPPDIRAMGPEAVKKYIERLGTKMADTLISAEEGAERARRMQPIFEAAKDAYEKLAAINAIGPIQGRQGPRFVASIAGTKAEELRQQYDKAFAELQLFRSDLLKGQGAVTDFERRLLATTLPELNAINAKPGLEALKRIDADLRSTIARPIREQERGSGRPTERPASRETPDPLAAAREAIKKGAPREAVIKRLKDNGIDPSGL